MNRETMKSIILVILIAFSLVLTVALWQYQPATETLEDDGVIEDTKLEGLGETAKVSDVIVPDDIIFHEETSHFTFNDIEDKTSFFKRMQEWNLTNIDISPGPRGTRNVDRAVEIIFPESIPLQTIGDLFVINDETVLQNVEQNYDRIILARLSDPSAATMYELWFIQSGSDHSDLTLRANINANAGEQALSKIESKSDLQELMSLSETFEEADPDWLRSGHIYLPKEVNPLPEVVLQTDAIPVTPLQNDLFPSPESGVTYETNEYKRKKTNERLMDIYDDSRLMEYVWLVPNSVNQKELKEYELLVRSVQDINSHWGWTEDFRLDSLSAAAGNIQYRMYYNDTPVMAVEDTYHLPSITQEYQEGQIQRYVRPLVKFKRFETGDNFRPEMESTEEVIATLQQMESLSFDEILGVEVRYTLEEQPSKLAYSLIPEWYYRTNTTDWTRLFEEREPNQNEELS
ncbi:YycH family regulatory protein [Halobacillus litoralis]|uniref:YycH family regulatory protein n=1 Tax=Halobacillus litoralis TaxID=45668 RepID=UPI001CFEDA32|nr:two-component system activity regulator YycH [Halobacillus litoralis]